MTTTVAPTKDLSWVTFSDDDGTEQCEMRDAGALCAAQAVCVGIYVKLTRVCPHPDRVLYCLRHRDWILGQATMSGHLFRCCACGDPRALARLLRVVPL